MNKQGHLFSSVDLPIAGFIRANTLDKIFFKDLIALSTVPLPKDVALHRFSRVILGLLTISLKTTCSFADKFVAPLLPRLLPRCFYLLPHFE